MDSNPPFLLQKSRKLLHSISIVSKQKGSFRLCILLPDWLRLAAKVCRLLRSARNASTQAQKVLFPWTFACTSLLGQGNNASSKCFRQPHGGAITNIFLVSTGQQTACSSLAEWNFALPRCRGRTSDCLLSLVPVTAPPTGGFVQNTFLDSTPPISFQKSR